MVSALAIYTLFVSVTHTCRSLKIEQPIQVQPPQITFIVSFGEALIQMTNDFPLCICCPSPTVGVDYSFSNICSHWPGMSATSTSVDNNIKLKGSGHIDHKFITNEHFFL